MKLRDLTELIRGYERNLAYGSETTLWGVYWAEYRDKIEDDTDYDTPDVEIDDVDADVWLAAYARMAEFEAEGDDYNLDDLF